MTEEEAKNLKVGDLVLVRCRVEDGGAHSARVSPDDGDNDTVRVLFHAIETVLPRPLEVGDRVRALAGGQGRILALHEGYAWVAQDGVHEPLGYILSALERLP
jgi:hypothetical protein